jgi:NTF2 fold immunity protein
MLRFLVILAMCLSACAAGQAQTVNDEIHLRAIVQAVVPLTSFSGQVTLVDVDPRFALTVHIESTVPAVANFSAGAVVTLAIHSPSRLFAGDPTIGKTYDFSVGRRVEDGSTRFVGLRLAIAHSTGPQDKSHGYKPKDGFVADSQTAVKIAEAVLIPVYGEEQIRSEEPFTAQLKGDVWTVGGTLRCPDGKGGFTTTDCDGGVAVVRLSKADGRVLFMMHYK